MVTLGPGATNALSGIADAYMDLVPVIMLISQIDSRTGPDDVHQKIPLHTLYKPVTRFLHTVAKHDCTPARLSAGIATLL